MDAYELSGMLFGHKRAESDASERLRDLTISGVAESDSADGLVSISLDGDLTQAEDDGLEHDHTILIPTEVGVYAGDEVAVTLTGADLSTLRVTGVVGDGDRVNARISGIEADYVKATELEADVADIGFLKVDSAVITDIQADTAKVHNLTAQEISAATGYVADLQAGSVTAQDIISGKATIGELEADHVSVSDFQAEQANIDSLQAATADIDTIRANSAKVQNLTAAQLEADHATIGTLDTTYMHANMSNSDVAWISNGTIKDGAITNAMINSVSANKLTAGTIDASEITVTNLNADNITTGTINGQRIGEGSLSLDKLSESVYTEAEVNTIVDGLNDRIDGAIETHTGTAVPMLNNSPASSWNTTKLRDEHVGDVYYVVNSQSQQNGYCYRFTKSGSTYSWQLIKDSDVTAALSRLTTAEGKITTFDSDISQLKTDTGTLTTKTTSLETRMSDAESDILDKVDTTTFNSLEDTVDGHTQTLSQHTTAISNKADSSTVTAVTNRVSKNEQDISGINTTIGELQETVESKADGSTVSTISNKLNTVSDTVDGHTQTLTSVQNTLSNKADSSTVSTLTTKVNNVSDTVDGHTSQLSSITSTQTTMQGTLDKTVKSSIQLWYSKANTTAPSKPTSQVTSTSTSGNAWRIVVPAYNASYPHYYYCWQYEYTDGTYGWSAVVRDIAMGESQSTARTADSNASAAVTTANTASTNASTALSTANAANTNASDAKTAAATASTTASEAKTTAETAASDASTAKTNAASAVTTANSASTTATNAQTTANANIKSSVQLWFTKANSTAPNKPTSVVSTSNANTANAWNLVVPVWNSSYPHYFYCYQQQKGDGNYQWTDVVYDRATSEAQQLANTTSTNLSTLQTNYATFKQQTEQFESTVGTTYATKTELNDVTDDITELEGRVSTNETSISNNASAIALKADSSDVYTKSGVDGLISTEVTNRNAAITAKANEITSSVSQTYTTKEESKQAIDYVSNAESNYGFQYCKDIVIFGDSDKYYPVYFVNLTSQYVPHEVMIMRGYSEQAPDDWNTSTHKGALNLRISWNYGGWGGATYKAEITAFSQMYSTMLGDVLVGTDAGMFSIVFLRGGGTVGALYHVYSQVPFDRHAYMANAGVVGENDVPYVGLNQGTVYAKNGSYQWTVRAPLTTPNTSHIDQLYTVQRVVNAESAITQNANNIELKVSKDGVISSINQSAETVKIQASKVEIDGTAVFSAISDDVDDAITSKGYQTSSQVNSAITSKGYATTTQAQGYATTAKSEAISAAATDATSKANAAQTAATNAANAATDQKLTSYSTTQQMNEAIQDATGPLFYGRENSSGYIHLGHVSYAVSSANNYSHLHLTGRIGGWASYTSGSIDVTFKSRNDAALYNTVDRRDEAIDTSFVDVLVYTGTDNLTHYWLKVNSYWYAQLYAEFEQFVEDDHTRTTTEPDGTCVWKLSEHTAVAVPKANAVKRTQRIWYRKSTSGAPSTPGTASSNWVTKDDDGNDAWTKMHIAISSTHKYIYTCEQYEMANGTVGYTSVLLDNTITVIDGGNIITGTVTANKLNAANINASKTLTVGAMTDDAASTILNSNMSVGGRNLLRNTGDFAEWLKSGSYSGSATNGIWTFPAPSSLNWSSVGSPLPNLALSDYDGETLTLSFDYRSDDFSDTSGSHCVYVNVHGYASAYTGTRTKYRQISIPTFNGVFVPTTEWQRGSITFTMSESLLTSGSGTVTYFGITFYNYTLNSYQLRHVKLEKGNKATDWTPAPEDVDSAISNAAKTATSYVTDITGGGIMVHPSGNQNTGVRVTSDVDILRSGTSVANYGTTARIGTLAGKHVSIDSDSVDLMDGNASLATFGANDTHIGMSGTGNVYMANDKFLLSAETTEGETVKVVSGLHAQNIGTNYRVYSGIESTLVYDDDGQQTTSTTVIEAKVDNGDGTALDWANIRIFVDPVNKTQIALTCEEIGLSAYDVWYQDPYNATAAALQLGKPVQRSASSNVSITSTNTWVDGPTVSLDAGYWMVVGVACFNSGSSSGSRKLRAQLRLGSSVYAEGTEVRAATNEYGRIQASAVMYVSSTANATLVLSSSMNFTTATTSYITAVQLA